jgi:hypothetical protein
VPEPERSRAGDRPPAAGHDGRRDRGRDYRDGRRDGRDRADSRGAATERTGNGYREGRREDQDRDGRRDERRHDSRERGRDAQRESRDPSRDRDRGEYEQKRSRPPLPAEPGTAISPHLHLPPEHWRMGHTILASCCESPPCCNEAAGRQQPTGECLAMNIDHRTGGLLALLALLVTKQAKC